MSPHTFRRRSAQLLVATLPVWALASNAQAEEPVEVVTSFSVLADIVRQVGGDHVEVTSLVGADSDPHVYSPRPSDARSLAEADLVVLNGLQFEGWMTRLLDSSGYEGKTVVATDGIEPLPYEGHSIEGGAHDHNHDHDQADEAHGHSEDHDHSEGHAHAEEAHDHASDEHGVEEHAAHDEHGDHAGHHHGEFDPHAWLDLAAGQVYAANVRDGLIAVDPEHEADYREQAQAYIDQLAAADQQIHAMFEEVPANAEVIVNHDAFGHFARAYGVHFLSPVGLSTEAEPSAADIARLIETVKERQIPALYLESMSSPRLIEQLSEETGVPIVGTLYTGALSVSGDTSSYLGMVMHNATILHDGLAGTEQEDHDH